MRIVNGKWNVEYTDEFEAWWLGLTDAAQDDIDLLGGDKTGRDDWYEKNVPIAERLFADHLVELEKEREDGNERTS